MAIPTEPTVRQLRRWQRRAETLERNARALTNEMIEIVGVEYEAGGENFTSQADDTAASAENLANYITFCADLARRAKRDRAAPTQQEGEL